MPAKRKPFIILILGDRDSYGFDEQTLPALVSLMESADPDYRQSHHAVTGYFVASAGAVERVEGVIARAEELRRLDARFRRLDIGVGAGEMLAEFTLLGRLKPSAGPPLGTVADDASRLVTAAPDVYRSCLDALRAEYRNA